MSDGKTLILEQCISNQPIKVSGQIGLRVPCYSCAPGKSILAELPKSELEKYLSQITFKNFTKNTLSSRSLLVEDLKEFEYAVMPWI